MGQIKRLFVGLSSMLVCWCSHAQTITTACGNGFSGYYGDGGPATAAEFLNPQSIAFDRLGNLIVADAGNNVVRSITPSGTVVKICGTGQNGYAGDGGPASAALIFYPACVAADPAGNVYIADAGNNVIRKIDTGGIISTVAGNATAGFSGDGGPATAAQLNFPVGISFDSYGNLLIADRQNNCIRRITTDGNIHTVAGNHAPGYTGDGGAATAASLYSPSYAIAVSGYIYIADCYNFCIRVVNPAGVISTKLSNAANPFFSPYMLSADESGNVYYTDRGNMAVGMLPWSGGAPVIIAGNGTDGFSGDGGPATAAAINNPGGIIAGTGSGTYFADMGNNRIRVINPDSTINTFAGGSQAGIGNGGMASAAQLFTPANVAADAVGNLYISDQGNFAVRKIDLTGKISLYAGNGLQGTLGDGGPATAASLNTPAGVAADLLGNVFIADAGSSVIRKVDPTGTITTICGTGLCAVSGDGGPATAAAVCHPAGLATDSAGALYICDYGNHRVRKIDTSGVITTIAGTGSAGYNGDSIMATTAQLHYPSGIAVDVAGNVLFSDTYNFRVRKIDHAGIVTTVAGNGFTGYSGDTGPATAGSLGQPVGVCLDFLGNMYITDKRNDNIRLVDVSGTIYTYAGTGWPGFSGDGGPAVTALLHTPAGAATDPAGNLYIADEQNQRLRKVTRNLAVATVPTLRPTVSVYPNPCTNHFQFRAETTLGNEVAVVLRDVAGRPLKVLRAPANQWTTIATDVAPGIYLLEVSTPAGASTVKVEVVGE